MSRFLFLLVLLIGLSPVQSAGEHVAVTYYVKPSQSPLPASCPTGQNIICETLQCYVNHEERMINQRENVTMIFLEGNHSTFAARITAPVIRIIGEGQNIHIQVSFGLKFSGNDEVHLENVAVHVAVLNITHMSKVSCLVSVNVYQ